MKSVHAITRGFSSQTSCILVPHGLFVSKERSWQRITDHYYYNCLFYIFICVFLFIYFFVAGPMLTPSPPFLPQDYLFTFPLFVTLPFFICSLFLVTFPSLPILGKEPWNCPEICLPCLVGVIYTLPIIVSLQSFEPGQDVYKLPLINVSCIICVYMHIRSHSTLKLEHRDFIHKHV